MAPGGGESSSSALASVGRTRQKDDLAALEVIRVVRKAIQSALDSNEVDQETLSKAVGVSKAHVKMWLGSSVSCPQWDAKFSDWLERVQDEALNARFTNPSRRRPPRRTPLSVPAPAAVDPVALNKLIEDLLELENYIPWNAVVSVWGCKRAAWARRVRACTDLLSVIRQIIALEESMCPYAFDPAWRKGDRDNWRVTLLSSTVPKKVGGLVRDMEERMRWQRFGKYEELLDRFKAMLKMPVGSQLKHLDTPRKDPSDAQDLPQSAKEIQVKISQFGYDGLHDLAYDCCELANRLPDAEYARESIIKILQLSANERKRMRAWQGCMRNGSDSTSGAAAGDREGAGAYYEETLHCVQEGGEQDDDDEDGEETRVEQKLDESSDEGSENQDDEEDVAGVDGEDSQKKETEAGLERVIEQEHEEEEDAKKAVGSYEISEAQDEKELAASLTGVSRAHRIISKRISIASDTTSSNELLSVELELSEEVRLAGAKRERVEDKEAKFQYFKKQQSLHPEYAGIYADSFIGTNLNMRRFQELLVCYGAATPECVAGALHMLPDTTLGYLRHQLGEELGFDGVEHLRLRRAMFIANKSAGATLHQASCPLPSTQNHKLAYPFFSHPEHVLVVDRAAAPLPLSLTDVQSLRRPHEKLLCEDVSFGKERHPVPVFNGADDEPAPKFTYVTQCVAGEAFRLLLGGPIREPWLCPGPCLASNGKGQTKSVNTSFLDYDELGRLRHAAHIVDSIYECSLLSNCRPGCRNRLVQLGPRFRLEVFRCPNEGRFSKGWGVRSPDRIPKGSFVCEYIGEYISDDEAESRGTRYDKQRMSRLMDVVGDGKESLRMCIDATFFSNLGRFLNHSCDPNCFKQRVFCDHHARLPRVAFFALTDIEPLDELCYDYGYADVPGKTMPCLCGARNCSKLLY